MDDVECVITEHVDYVQCVITEHVDDVQCVITQHVDDVQCVIAEHVDDVRAIVQRAIKDLSIEQSLKTYEEVWLSKKFELCEHARNKAIVQNMTRQEQEEANMVSQLFHLN